MLICINRIIIQTCLPRITASHSDSLILLKVLLNETFCSSTRALSSSCLSAAPLGMPSSSSTITRNPACRSRYPDVGGSCLVSR